MAGLECPPIGDWWEDGWGAIMVPGCWEIMMVPGGSWSCGVSLEDERGEISLEGSPSTELLRGEEEESAEESKKKGSK